MTKVYLVKHCYDTDGGFGDAVSQEEVLCGFNNEDEAYEFVKTFENPHIYDRPYASLECGRLIVEELNMIPPKHEDMWWLH